MKIRSATTEDAPPITRLCGQLGYPASAKQTALRLEAVMESEGHCVLVACSTEAEVVGWVHVFQAVRVESESFAELGGLVVAEDQRGSGIGRSLVAAAEQWAKAQRMGKLRVRTRSGRADAHAFYRRMGFSLNKEQHVYDKPLAGRDE